MADHDPLKPGTIAEQIADQKRRSNPGKRILGIVVGLVFVLLLFSSVFIISGVFQLDENGSGDAPWSAKEAPVVKPAPIEPQ